MDAPEPPYEAANSPAGFPPTDASTLGQPRRWERWRELQRQVSTVTDTVRTGGDVMIGYDVAMAMNGWME